MKKPLIILIEALMNLEINFATLYKNIASQEETNNISLINVAKILAREELRHMELYKNLIKELNNKPPILIEEELLNTAKSYLLTFKQSLNTATGNTVKELLSTALEFEINNGLLLKKLVEVLAAEDTDYSAELVIIFEKLIIEEQKHAKNIRSVLN